jgi:hypothetical protein
MKTTVTGTFFKYLSWAIAFALLSACQSLPTSFRPDASEALQIMQIEGGSEGLRDVSQEDFDKALGRKSNNDVLELSMATGYASGLLRAPTGFSGMSASGLHLLTFFTAPSFLAGEVSRMMAWMPESLASDEKDAQRKVAKMVEEAVIKALPPGYSTRIQEWTDTAVFGAESHFRVIRVDGEHCENWSCVIEGQFPSKDRLPVIGRMSKTRTPFFLEHSESSSYRFNRYYWVKISKIVSEFDEVGKINGHWHRLKTEYLEGFNHTEWYVKISELLPKWAYYYHAPHSRKPNQSVFPLPLILNQGKPMYFIKPET